MSAFRLSSDELEKHENIIVLFNQDAKLCTLLNRLFLFDNIFDRNTELLAQFDKLVLSAADRTSDPQERQSFDEGRIIAG